jgi:enamine deaminase RidA (YjgF/YER057c/UK114 family)
MNIEARLEKLGLRLPETVKAPTGTRLPFAFVRTRGNKAYISGHGPLNLDGSISGPFGKVGAEVTVEEGYQAARSVGLAILASLKRELGDLDRVVAWLKVYGMVNATSDFTMHPAVINGFSDLILELYGQEAGQHARSAVGMASLPFAIAVEIEAEVEIVS